MRLSFFSIRAAHDAQVMPWTARSRVVTAAAGGATAVGGSVADVIPRLVDRRSDRGVVERGRAGHGDEGRAVRHELDRDVLDAVERGELLGDGLDAVAAGHADDGQRDGGGYLDPSNRAHRLVSCGRAGRWRPLPRGPWPGRR